MSGERAIPENVIRIMEERSRRPKPIEVGYLSGPFEQGEVPEGFIDNLLQVQESALHSYTMGHHTCRYCFPGGDDELHSQIDSGVVKKEATSEVQSSGDYHLDRYKWPDMLRHYIATHKYLPPQDFIDAIGNYRPESVDHPETRLRLPELPDFRV